MARDVTNVTGPEVRVGELVRQRMDGLSPAERKLARVLLASYPIAGLESVARFAERARVSPPTVTRFISKLGFRGYPEFQEILRHEVQDRLSSPLARYRRSRGPAAPETELQRAFEAAGHNLAATRDLLSQRDLDETIELLSDTRRAVAIVGGRVSSALAHYLAGQLQLLRPEVALGGDRSSPSAQLVDLKKRDVLVVFDYRRYQADTIETARVAAAKGCVVILFTDPWLSPASAYAGQVLVTSMETVGPFDSLLGALAVVEAVVAGVLRRLGPRAEARMQTLERLRAGDVLGGADAVT